MWILIMLLIWTGEDQLLAMCLLLAVVLSWRATLQSVVALSTSEAEYMVICEACKELIRLKGLYAELSEIESCISLHCDSQSAIYLTKDQMFHERTRYARLVLMIILLI
jgi:hypothetical protein